MKAFVLDASVAVSWCFPGDPGEATPYHQMILRSLEEEGVEAVVPEVWAFEIANCLYVSFAKRKRITEDRIAEYLDDLQSLPIRMEPNDPWSNVALESLARKHDLAAYDIAYIDLAMRLELPLATSDGALKKAASAEGVRLVAEAPAVSEQ